MSSADLVRIPPPRGALERLTALVQEGGLVRSGDLVKLGIHREYLRIACQRGLIRQVCRGVYAAPSGHSANESFATACKRVRRAVLCLESALYFHGLVEKLPKRVWVALDRKARKPPANVPVRVVRFSGEALTQGCVNTRILGVPARVYSPMKMIADCFKYRNKIGVQIGVRALHAAIDSGKYNRQKLLRFAEICRVKKIVLEYADQAEKGRTDRVSGEQATNQLAPIWDRDVLLREVWSEPLKHVARRYGVSDVALGKRCKRLNIELPGRGYWAKRNTAKHEVSES